MDFTVPDRDISDGGALLHDIEAFIRRFVALPTPAGLVAVTLWAAHTHLIAYFENTPRIAFLSPEPGSGKTRAQEVLELLVPEPMHVLNASPAAIFRTIQIARPTLLLDEVDTVFTRRGKDDEHQDLRALLNSGYRAGATIPRCVGPRHEVQMFPTFCAVALAGLGDLPDTLMTRSVVIRMRRRAPGEKVESFRRRLHRADGHDLRDRMTAWAAEIAQKVTDVYPKLPDGITDRPADVWEPLLAVADAAGGTWPRRARAACLELVKAGQSTDSGSLGVRLLADLRTVFTIFDTSDPERPKPSGQHPHLFTETILELLHKIDDAPWDDLRGKPLDARGLSSRLRQYGVSRTKVRIGAGTRQGYRAESLHDPWTRYLPVPDPADGEHEEHPEHRRSDSADSVPHVHDHEEHPEHPQLLDLDVPEHDPDGEHNPPPLTCGVPHVPHVPDPAMNGRADVAPEPARWRASGDLVDPEAAP